MATRKLRTAVGSRRYQAILARMHEWLRAGHWEKGMPNDRNRPQAVEASTSILLENAAQAGSKVVEALRSLGTGAPCLRCLEETGLHAEFFRSLFRENTRRNLRALAELAGID